MRVGRRRAPGRSSILTVLFDGVAYGMVLFILACGLAVTLGLMNVVNLAHGVFAMAGGYAAIVAVNQYGVPFLAGLPIAFAASALLGLVLERTLYRQLYARSHFDQVLFSIGLVFMSVAIADRAAGSQPIFADLPPWLGQRYELAGLSMGAYRLLIIALCGVIAVLLQLVLSYTRFGARLRAAVDDPRVARGLGIDVDRIFALTFATGSGLAGLGGALGAQILGLEPTFPLKFMIYFLIVVTVGGTASIGGAFLAALLLGIADVAGKYYVPEIGAFVIYGVMVGVLIWRPQGLFGRVTVK